MKKKEALAQLEKHLSSAPIELKEYTLKSWEAQANDTNAPEWSYDVFLDWRRSKQSHSFWSGIGDQEWQEAQEELNRLGINIFEPNPEYDHINPDHYKQGGKEVIEKMLDIWGKEAVATHCEITAFKYRMRLGLKPDQPIERDIEKAKWYEAKAKELRQ